MTPSDLTPIVHQATKNAAADRSWCLLSPAQVLALCHAHVDALERMREIAALTVECKALLADNHLAHQPRNVRAVLREIEELALDKL